MNYELYELQVLQIMKPVKCESHTKNPKIGVRYSIFLTYELRNVIPHKFLLKICLYRLNL